MATITIPEGFTAVVIMFPKDDGEPKLEFVGHPEGAESAVAADAIPILVDYMADEIVSLIDELNEKDEEEPEGEDEPVEPS